MFEVVGKHTFGELKFGMTPNQVRQVMGEKTTWENWMGGNLNDSLFYPGIIIHFDKCDARGPLESSSVCGIEMNRSFPAFFMGELAFRMDYQTFMSKLKSENLDFRSKVYDEDNSDRTYEIFVETYGLELSFDSEQKLEFIEMYG